MKQCPVVAIVVLLAGGQTRADDPGIEFFEKRIRPVLVEHCYKCHSARASKVKGGQRLDSKRAALAGGDSGPVIVSGKPAESLLIEAVSHSGEFVDMPPDRKLPDRVIDDFRRWIAIGAPLPVDSPSTGSPQPQKSIDIEAGRRFWSFQPVSPQSVPEVSDTTWPMRKLDWFVLKQLDVNRLAPSPPADGRTLMRRVCFDLTGLPPSPGEVDAFVNDPAPDRYERLVERLLASPHYGERWGRHWLDVARYAEDNPTGESTCKPPPYPWPYRDWVIQALNDDLPYDEFVRRQLAADLMDLPLGEIAATGFLGLSPVYHKEPKLSAEVIKVIVSDEWDERLDTVTRGFLGLTVACARCHDHKFDPIRSADYYATAGVMASTQLVEWPLTETSLAEAEALTTTREAIVDYELRVSYAGKMRKAAEIEGAPTKPFEDLAAKQKTILDEWKSHRLFDGPIANVVRDAGVWVNGADPDWTNMSYRPGDPRDLPIFVRGNPNNPGEVVRRRFLEVLSTGPPQPFDQGSGRLELANAIVSDAAPLAARVIVNRIWGWHFGQPLVRTPGNFGALGERPSHPLLLDDLAARFVDRGWSMKWLHREIVLSATYRQTSAQKDAANDSIDPDNRLLWRMNRQRLDPEVWRDSVLAVSGKLNRHMFGKSHGIDDPKNLRRTVYGTITRQNPADVLRLFDFPDAKRHAGQRTLTTPPLQQLYLLNGPFLHEAAEAVSQELADEPPTELSVGIRRLFRAVLQREPSKAERDISLELIKPTGPESDLLNWRLLAHSLLATNEFLFID